jgi:hypothetical protein
VRHRDHEAGKASARPLCARDDEAGGGERASSERARVGGGRGQNPDAPSPLRAAAEWKKGGKG